MFLMCRRHRALIASATLVVALLAAVLATPSPSAMAQRSGAPLPRSAQWCGLTDTGGSVLIGLTSDRRFVDWVTIRLPSFSIDTDEMNAVTPAQIADGMFTVRADSVSRVCRPAPGSGSRCTRAPCHPRCTRPPCDQECEDVVTNQLLIRGTFTSADSLRGSYSAVEPGGSSSSRIPTDPRRYVGSFVAWPVGSAPCP